MTLLLIGAAVLFLLWILVRAARLAGEALREQGRPVLRFDDAELLELVAEKRQALSHLKEGELDFETGKVGELDYADVKAENTADAIQVMERLDAVRAGLRHSATVEQDLAALAQDGAAPGWAQPQVAKSRAGIAPGLLLGPDVGTDGGLSPAAQLRRSRQGLAMPEPEGAASVPPKTPALACPGCAAEVLASDKFCPSCGHGLSRACAQCGVALRPGTRFCHECGTPIGQAAEQA